MFFKLMLESKIGFHTLDCPLRPMYTKMRYCQPIRGILLFIFLAITSCQKENFKPTATWKEFHDHHISDPELGKDYIIPIEGIPLFDRIGKVIPDDKRVSNRRFEFAELVFNCLGENVYRYNEFLRTIPSDQAGKPFANVVNGMGIVGSRHTRSVSILFDYRSLSELCNGEYTKHLKFVLW